MLAISCLCFVSRSGRRVRTTGATLCLDAWLVGTAGGGGGRRGEGGGGGGLVAHEKQQMLQLSAVWHVWLVT